MKVIKILVVSVIVVVLAVAAGVTYLVNYLDAHKDQLADTTGTWLGREVRIEKGVTLNWSLTPSIAVDGLWIGNPSWAKGEYFAQAERALVRLRLLALLRRRLELKEVTIQGADVRLEAGTDGKNNWSFGEEGGGLETEVESLAAENSRLSYRQPDGGVMSAVIPEIMLDGLGTKEVGFKARFNYREVPITASLNTAPQMVSLAGERPFQGSVEMPGATLRVSGDLKGLFELTKLEVEAQIDRLDLQNSVLALWYSLPVAGVLQKVNGRFETAGDTTAALFQNLQGHLDVRSAALKVPGEDVNGARQLDLNGLKLVAAPKQPIRLSSKVIYGKQPYQVELEGGLLGDLFADIKSWKVLKFKSTGEFEGSHLELKGSAGPLSAITSGRNLDVKLQARYGELAVQADGRLASLGKLQGSQMAVDVSGPSLSRLTPWLGMNLPDSQPFRFNGRLSADRNHLELQKFKLTTGDSDVAGNLRLPLAGGGTVTGTLQSQTLNLGPLLEPMDRAKREAHVETPPLLERDLPVDLLGERDGSLKIKIGRLRLGAIEIEQLELDGRLAKGHLRLEAKAEGERVSADVDLRPTGTGWHLAVRHSGSFQLGDLIDRGKHHDDRSQSPVSIDADLKGSGRTLADMLESTDGSFTMVMGEGLLSENISEHIPMGDVMYAILRVIDPLGEQQSQSKLECAVIHLQVSKGVATSPHGLAMRTEEMNVLGGGAFTLRDGMIDLEFKTAQRKGLGLSVVGVADKFIRLTGTVWEPTVGVNAKSALAHGAAAWATSGLSLLFDSTFRRLTASSNPCERVQTALGK